MAEQDTAIPTAKQSVKFWIVTGFAVVCVGTLVILLLGWLFAGDQNAQTGPGDEIAGIDGGPLTMLPQDIVTDPPRLTIEPSVVEFGQVAYDPERAQPIVKVITVRFAGGYRSAIFLATSGIETQNPNSAVKVRRIANDCYAGPQKVREDHTYCDLQIEWGPVPGEKLDGKLRISVNPDLDVFVGRDLPDLWENFEIEATLKGVADPEPPRTPLVASPTQVEMGVVKEGESRTQRISLQVAHRPVDVVNVEWRDAPIRTLILEKAGCEAPVIPPSSDVNGQCTMKLTWAPRANEKELNNELWVDWTYRLGPLQREAAAVQRIKIPVQGKLPEEVIFGEDTKWIRAEPTAVDFGEWPADYEGQSFSRRVIIHAGPVKVRIERAEIFAEISELAANSAITKNDCLSSGNREIEPGQYCEIHLSWTPKPGALLKANLQLTYRVQGKRREESIEMRGSMIRRAAVQAPDNEELRLKRGRAELRRRWALPVLADGVGMLEAQGIQPPDGRLQGQDVDPQNVWDQDYTGVGLQAEPGISSRPVRLTAMVPAGTPIPVTLARTFDVQEP